MSTLPPQTQVKDMPPIYLIQQRYERSDYNGREYWSDEIDHDWGYFPDLEEAEAFVFSMNSPFRDRYTAYTASVERLNVARRIDAKEKLTQWQETVAKNAVLRKAGFEAKDPKKPSGTSKDVAPLSYEEWSEDKNVYSVAAIPRGVVR